MKVPVSWLRSFVDLGDLGLDELVDVMSLHGLEVEEVLRPGRGTAGVRVKRVVDRAPHPDADKLQVVTVTDGEHETELVCGAWNFEVGDVVAHAEVGATIPAPAGESRPFELAARPIRGVLSNGMLCSARELQLGDDHTGILVLPPETPLGVELTDLLPLGEPVIDVAVLSDRGDHHSILGIARELAAVLDTDLLVPAVPEPDAAGAVDIRIEAPDGCRHFVTWAIDRTRVGPSPWWLRQRLAQCGIRAINTVVDVTNYVMLELGQPLHAFDLERLEGPELTVRWARDGERLVTLDDQERVLASGDLVITDASRIVSLAGVMGGADTEVSDATQRILIEGAVWEPLTIRRTSRRLNLVSEASLRFERGVDPAGARRAVARAAGLLTEIAGARPGGHDEAGAPRHGQDAVTIEPRRVAGLLGVADLDPATQADYLRRLGCDVDQAGERLTVTPPSWRRDLTRPADLAEEVARLHGYERIPAELPDTRVVGGLTREQRAEREIRAAALAGGFHEVTTRPFTGAEVLEAVAPSTGRVRPENPLAKDAPDLAPTLIEGLLAVIRRNVGQGRPGTAVFQYDRIFRPSGDPVEEALKAFGDSWRWRDPEGRALPTQPRTLGLAAQGVKMGAGWLEVDEVWSPYDLLAVLDEIVTRLSPPDEEWLLERVPERRDGYHPGRAAVLRLRGTDIGFVGELHPSEAARRDLPEPVVVAELLVEPLFEHLGDDVVPVQARPLVTHPAMTIDVALAAPHDVGYADLAAAVRAGAGELLDELWVFDEYRGEQVGPGQRSVAMRLRLQASDRQLTDDDAEAVIAAVGREAELIGAALRR